MKSLRKLLFPISLIFDAITRLRNFCFDKGLLKSTKFKTPTIVVGNLSLGGTGKTPQIEYLVRLLSNYKIAILSRGYRRKSNGFIIADANSTFEMLGDEPFQYFKKFKNCIVAVDSNRTNGIQQLEKLENPPQVILLDDAFQHRRVQAGFTILLTTYDALYSNDYIFPVGNLRESKLGVKRAQLIVVSKCPENLTIENQIQIIQKLKPGKNQAVFFSAISYKNKLQGSCSEDLKNFKEGKILLVTGIADPKPLLNYLRSHQIKFEHVRFKDHHHFSDKDIQTIQTAFNKITAAKKIILTTEKDYVRIFDKLQNLSYIAIETTIINSKTNFDKLINNYVEQSSRNS